MNIAQAKQRLGISDLWEKMQLPGHPKKSCRSPFRADEKASFSISSNDQLWYDHATGECGDQIAFLATGLGIDNARACRIFIDLAEDCQFLPPSALRVPTHLQREPDRAPGMIDSRRTLRESTGCELEDLAQLRQIPAEALKHAEDRGLLRFGIYRGTAAWFITDEERFVAQARRLDGAPWNGGSKACNLAGSTSSHPVGIAAIKKVPAIALVEGGPDLLAACHFIQTEGLVDIVAPVALLGAGIDLGQHARRFQDKRVYIFSHADAPGRAAAARWSRDLSGVASAVHQFDFAAFSTTAGHPVKDLNDLCLAPLGSLPIHGIFAEVKQ